MPAGRIPRTRLTRAQTLAVEEMVKNGSGLDRTARAAGVPKATVKLWLSSPLFQEAVTAAQKEMEDETWARLRAATIGAAETLVAISNNQAEKGSVRLMAANSILDRTGHKAVEQVQVQAQPFTTREEMVAALAAMPADVLAEALGKVRP